MSGVMTARIAASGPRVAPIIQLVGYAVQSWANTTAPIIDLVSGLTFVDGVALQIEDVVVVAVGFADIGGVDPEDPTMATAGYTAAHAILSQVNNARIKLRTFYKTMGLTPDTTVQSGNFVSDRSGSVAVFVLRHLRAAVLDVTTTTASGSGNGNADAPAIMPVTAGAWIMPVCFGGHAGTASYSISGLAVQADTSTGITGSHAGNRLMMGVYTGWTSGSYDPPAASTLNVSGLDCWVAATLAFIPTNLTSPPVFTVNPSITSANGFYGVGDVLTGVPGTHNGTTSGYQWLRDGVAIGGETGLSYTLVSGDKTHLVTFQQTAVNAIGSQSAASSSIGPVDDPAFSVLPITLADASSITLNDASNLEVNTRTA